MPCTCSVRDIESGLYCSVITRCTAPLDGSTSTRPPRTSLGEPGKAVMAVRSGCVKEWKALSSQRLVDMAGDIFDLDALAFGVFEDFALYFLQLHRIFEHQFAAQFLAGGGGRRGRRGGR